MGNSVCTVAGLRLKIKGRIAEGGFSEVYLAREQTTRQLLTLKRMRIDNANTDMLALAKAEVDVMQRVPRHPHIVEYCCSEMVPDETAAGFTVVNIVMEHMDGLTALDVLRQHHDAGHSLPEPLVWHIFQQACRAVAHLHAQSPPIAHRDLKVENLLLSGTDAIRSTVKLCDFGSCTTAAGAYTSPQAIAREAENIERYTTPQYRAPEMVDLHSGVVVDHRVDLWALGCLLFKLCFLRTPFEDRGGALQTMGVLSGRYTVPSGSAYSNDVAKVLAMLLRVNPDERTSAADIVAFGGASVGAWTTFSPSLRATSLMDRIRAGAAAADAGGRRGGDDAAFTPNDNADAFAVLGIDDDGPGDESKNGGGASTSARRGSTGRPRSNPSTSSRELHHSPITLPATTSGADEAGAGGRRSSAAASHGWAARRESMQTRFMQVFGTSESRRWVMKATSMEPGPPKPKYVRYIVVQVSETGSLELLAHHLPARPVSTDVVVACKVAGLTLKVLQMATSPVLATSGELRPLIGDIAATWREHAEAAAAQPTHGAHSGFAVAGRDAPLPAFVSELAGLVGAKIAFHAEYPAYTGFYCTAADGVAIARVGDAASSHPSTAPAPSSPMAADSDALRRELLGAVSRLLSIGVAVQKLKSAAIALAKAHIPPPPPAAAAGQAPGAIVTKQQRLIRHPDALCALGAVPLLVEEWYSVCRAAFLALLRLPATGMAKEQREQVHDSIKGLIAFMAEVGELADRSEIINVLTASLPVLSPQSPFTSVRAAHRLLSAASVIIPFALPGEAVGGEAREHSSATPSSHGESPVASGTPSGGSATPVTDGGGAPRPEVAIGASAHDGGDPSRRQVPPELVIVLEPVPQEQAAATLKKVMQSKRAGNRRCAECNAKRPAWASINLGIFVCWRCSGMHRQLGTHVSKVKSSSLDDWKGEWVAVAKAIGNRTSNKFWEARLSSKMKPTATSTPQEVLSFLVNKYEHFAWAADGPSPPARLRHAGAAGASVDVSASNAVRPDARPLGASRSAGLAGSGDGPTRSSASMLGSGGMGLLGGGGAVDDMAFGFGGAGASELFGSHGSAADGGARGSTLVPSLAQAGLGQAAATGAASAPSAAAVATPSAVATQPGGVYPTTSGAGAGAAKHARGVSAPTVSAATSAGLVDFDPFATSGATAVAAGTPGAPQPTLFSNQSWLESHTMWDDDGAAQVDAAVPVAVPVASRAAASGATTTSPPATARAPVTVAAAAPVVVTANGEACDDEDDGNPSGPGALTADKAAVSHLPPPSSGRDDDPVVRPVAQPHNAFSTGVGAGATARGGAGGGNIPFATGASASGNPFATGASNWGNPATDGAAPPAVAVAPPAPPAAAPSAQVPGGTSTAQPPVPPFVLPGFGAGAAAGAGVVPASPFNPFDSQPGGARAGAGAGAGAGGGEVAVPAPAPAPAASSSGDETWWTSLVIPLREVHVLKKIGTGGFADVFKAEYRGTEVAVKRLLTQPGAAGTKAIASFRKEMAMMTRLRHPNIVLFMGIIEEPLCMITEFCAQGNLFDLLHNRAVRLSWRRRMCMAMDAAKGMNFLHKSRPVIIHRDLKSLNLLVDDALTVKVADFGLSRFKASSSARYMTAQAGSWHWMAPEVISGHEYDEKADVYSFGIILWELFTRTTPYSTLEPMQVAMAVLQNGVRPPVPADAPKEYADLMERCWQATPAARPSFSEIIPLLQTLVRETDVDTA